MTRLICDMSMSLDGFVAGPHPSLEHPLGEGGERLHEWAFRLASFRESHGLEGGGETGPVDDVAREWLGATGAVVMGRRMFSGVRARGRATPTQTVGGATIRRFTCRCSSSPTTLARRS